MRPPLPYHNLIKLCLPALAFCIAFGLVGCGGGAVSSTPLSSESEYIFSSESSSIEYAPEAPLTDSAPSEASSSAAQAPGSSAEAKASGSAASSAPSSSKESAASNTSPSSSSASGTPAPSSSSAEPAVSSSSSSSASAPAGPITVQGEYRAIWVSYLDLGPMIKYHSESEFRASFAQLAANAKNLGLNTIIVHVRAFSDAFYQSAIFPFSSYGSSAEGVYPGYDPLKIMVELAHGSGLRLEAWINPYRIRTTGTISSLSDGNPAKKMSADAVKAFNGGIYYNPADTSAQNLIIDGVMEVVNKYDIDGIHFDDYFYPNPDTGFDSASYAAYKSAGGTLALKEWRWSNVDTLLKKVYAAIKAAKPNVTFGVSPQGNITNCNNAQYINPVLWMQNPGYVDYVCPQIYYGFLNKTLPFEATVSSWESYLSKTSGVKMYVGIAGYKLGKLDGNAGTGATTEWQNTTNILSRMVETVRQSGGSGFCLYSYGSLFQPETFYANQIGKELESLGAILK